MSVKAAIVIVTFIGIQVPIPIPITSHAQSQDQALEVVIEGENLGLGLGQGNVAVITPIKVIITIIIVLGPDLGHVLQDLVDMAHHKVIVDRKKKYLNIISSYLAITGKEYFTRAVCYY